MKITFLELTGLIQNSWTLLWRGSENGFDLRTMSNFKDYKHPTFMVIKNTEGCIFGSYAAVPYFGKPGYTKDEKAFIFGLSGGIPIKVMATDPERASYWEFEHDFWYSNRIVYDDG